jgi:hypothetical protein
MSGIIPEPFDAGRDGCGDNRGEFRQQHLGEAVDHLQQELLSLGVCQQLDENAYQKVLHNYSIPRSQSTSSSSNHPTNGITTKPKTVPKPRPIHGKGSSPYQW